MKNSNFLLSIRPVQGWEAEGVSSLHGDMTHKSAQIQVIAYPARTVRRHSFAHCCVSAGKFVCIKSEHVIWKELGQGDGKQENDRFSCTCTSRRQRVPLFRSIAAQGAQWFQHHCHESNLQHCWGCKILTTCYRRRCLLKETPCLKPREANLSLWIKIFGN